VNARFYLGVATIAAATAFVAAPIAHADELADARRHFRAGMDLIRRRQFDAGIAELETAYQIVPRPNVLYNIARAYYDSGNLERAVEYLRRYLQHDVSDRAEIEALIARLESRIRSGRGSSAVANNAAGATDTGANATSGGTSASTSATGTPTINVGALTGPRVDGSQASMLRALAEQLLAIANAQSGVGTSGGGTSGSTATSTGTMGATTANASGTASSGSGAGAVSATGNAAPVDTGSATSATNATGNAGADEVSSGISARDDDDEYEARVVTASRVAQSPLDAPNATGVITAQDIRLSGLTSIPQILRRIAGVDVMALDGADYQVSVRGFNQRLSNKVLVLVDGRSVYFDFLGVTLWPYVFPALEEIERIEVIRGPGSALYGADAYTGVINIITRPPGENRTQVSAGGGTAQQLRGAFLTSGRAGDVSYRASVQYEQQQSYGRLVSPTDRAWESISPAGNLANRNARFLLEAQGRLGRGVLLRGGVGGATGPVQFSALNLLRQFYTDLTFVQPFVQLDVQNFSARAFWNRVSFVAGPIIQPRGAPVLEAHGQQDVVDVDLQYNWRARISQTVSNTLQFGAGYRLKSISWNYLDNDHTLHFFSGFLQDTLRVGDRFSAVASLRADRHPVLDGIGGSGFVLSPRGALIFKSTERRAIRLTGGTAFRTPTMLELFLDLNLPTPTPGVSVRGYGGEVAAARINAARRLRPESAISFDLGFQDQTFEVFQYEVNLFFTRGWDRIDIYGANVDPLPGDLLPESRTVPVGARTYSNDPASTYVYGAELGLKLAPVEGLDFNVNYTLALTSYDANNSFAPTPERDGDQRTPMHKLNVGLQVRTRFGLELEAFGHYVSRQVWIEPVFDARSGSRDVPFVLNDYFLLNARAGLRLLDGRLELGVTGTNLVDVNPTTGHQEHPLGYRQWARVMANASYRF
jgi:iron complex outermembrane receptor protein